MLGVAVLPSARRDQLDLAGYYDSCGGPELGDKFLDCCETAFARLAVFPESGTKVRYRHPELSGCRFILTPEFDRIIIFYRVAGRIEIVRISHGARDIEGILEGARQ